jgi:hypothetical protein
VHSGALVDTSTRANPMSVIACDYRAEARAAAQIADTTTSETDRADWLFLALAWQALARSHDRKDYPSELDGPSRPPQKISRRRGPRER